MRVRVNFFLPREMYAHIQDIAQTEATTSSELFRKAIKKFIYDYKNDDINKFLEKSKAAHSSVTLPDPLQPIATQPETEERW